MVKHANLIYECITYYIYAYHDFWEKLRCSWNSAKYLAKSSMDAALEAMHTRMYAGFGGERIEYLYQSS